MRFISCLVLVFLGCNLKSPNNLDSRFPKKLKDIPLKDIPKSILVNGKLIVAKSWEDKIGENLLVVSYTGPTKEKEYKFEFSGAERYAELHSILYIKQNKKYNVLWETCDSIRHCPFDLWIGLLPESTTVTDLDSDSIAEVTLISKKTCRSDISPSNLKIQMHEKDSLMELTGRMELQSGDTLISENFEYDLSKIKRRGEYTEVFGRYLGEYDFSNKPRVFLEYARDKWKEYVRRDAFLQLDDE